MSLLSYQVYSSDKDPLWLSNPAPKLVLDGSPLITLSNNNGVLESNGVPVVSEPASNWYLYPTANNTILFGTDPETQDNLQAVGGYLYFNGEILAQAGDISNVADWYLYPALDDVDFNNNGLCNVSTINGVALSNYSACNWAVYPAVCNVDMSNNSISNCPGVSSSTGLTLAGDNFVVISNYETNPAQSSSVLVQASGGTGGTVNVRADKGIATGGAVVNIEALAGDIAGYGWGGTVNITAYSATSVGATSKVTISGAGVNSYAGAVPAVASLAGYNFIYGNIGVNICAGIPSIIPNTPLTTYIYGTAGVTLQSGFGGDVQVQNSDFGATYIKPYYSSLAPPSNLFITGRSNTLQPNQYVTLTMVNNIAFENLAFITGLKELTMSNGVICNVSNINLSNINGAPYSPTSTWSSFGATTNVDMCNFSICNVSNINGTPYVSPCNWASFPATTNVNMSNFSICNVSNVNGVLYTPTCNWACNVALNDVNMCNYSISNVSNINGSPYVATCNWALYNAVSNVGVGGYSVLFNTKGIREGAGFLNGASTSVEMYTPVSLAATTRAASVVFSKISGGVIDYTGDILLYGFNTGNPARLLAQSTYGTETVAYLSDVDFRAAYDLYVAPNGNDTTGDGSVLNPYLTIGKALTIRAGISSSIEVSIQVASGTYVESFTIPSNTYVIGIVASEVRQPTNITGVITFTGQNAGLTAISVDSGRIVCNSAGGVVSLNQLNITTASGDVAVTLTTGNLFITESRINGGLGDVASIDVTGGIITLRDVVISHSGIANAVVIGGVSTSSVIRQSYITCSSSSTTVGAVLKYSNTVTHTAEVNFSRFIYSSGVTDVGGNKCCIQFANSGVVNANISQCLLQCPGAVTGGTRIEVMQKTGSSAVNLTYGGNETLNPASFLATGITKIPMVRVDEGVYGCFSSSVTTQVTGANVPTLVNHNVVEVNSGVLSISGGNINLNRAGNYEVSTSIQFYKTGGGTDLVYFWLRLNGVDVTRSASAIRLANNNGEILGNVTCMISANAGDALSVVFGSADTTVYAQATGAQTTPMVVPAIPSCITSVKLLN